MSVINNPGRFQVHWDYARYGLGRSGMGLVYPRYSPLHWRAHYDYAPHGLGMIHPWNQNWRTSQLPFSLALANTVNTGVSFDTPSRGIAERQRWASRGFQGYGPRIQYPVGAGMDGLGCGCECGGSGGCGHGGEGWTGLLCLGAIAVAAYWMGKGNGWE